VDAPDLGGFISSTTIVNASLWRMGQLKSGDTIQYRRVSLKDALKAREKLERFLENVSGLVAGQCDVDNIEPISNSELPESTVSGTWGKALIHSTVLGESGIPMSFRQVRNTGFHFSCRLLTFPGRVEMTFY
jgi:hypothetical protein